MTLMTILTVLKWIVFACALNWSLAWAVRLVALACGELTPEGRRVVANGSMMTAALWAIFLFLREWCAR